MPNLSHTHTHKLPQLCCFQARSLDRGRSQFGTARAERTLERAISIGSLSLSISLTYASCPPSLTLEFWKQFRMESERLCVYLRCIQCHVNAPKIAATLNEPSVRRRSDYIIPRYLPCAAARDYGRVSRAMGITETTLYNTSTYVGWASVRRQTEFRRQTELQSTPSFLPHP